MLISSQLQKIHHPTLVCRWAAKSRRIHHRVGSYASPLCLGQGTAVSASTSKKQPPTMTLGSTKFKKCTTPGGVLPFKRTVGFTLLRARFSLRVFVFKISPLFAKNLISFSMDVFKYVWMCRLTLRYTWFMVTPGSALCVSVNALKPLMAKSHWWINLSVCGM